MSSSTPYHLKLQLLSYDLSMDKQTLRDKFLSLYGPGDILEVSAPGRINLIGEHTDYTGGYVLPAGTQNIQCHLLFRPRHDYQVRLYDAKFDETLEFSLLEITLDPPGSWTNYPKAVALALQEAGYELLGFDGLLYNEVPIGAGMSSSASLEVAHAHAFIKSSNLTLPPKRIATLCQRAENKFVGVQCGIMDQMASVLAKPHNFIFLDTHYLTYHYLQFDTTNFTILVIDTKVKRALAASEYNKRRAEAEAGIELLKKHHPEYKLLREVPPHIIDNLPLSPTLRKRLKHIIEENLRVLDAESALRESNYTKLGELLFESHESLRHLYEVSCPELNFLVDTGKQLGCLGARLMGAGFGGATIHLLKGDPSSYIQELTHLYEDKFGITPGVYRIDL